MPHKFVEQYFAVIKVIISEWFRFMYTCCQSMHPGLSCSHSKEAFFPSIQSKHQVKIIRVSRHLDCTLTSKQHQKETMFPVSCGGTQLRPGDQFCFSFPHSSCMAVLSTLTQPYKRWGEGVFLLLFSLGMYTRLDYPIHECLGRMFLCSNHDNTFSLFWHQSSFLFLKSVLFSNNLSISPKNFKS